MRACLLCAQPFQISHSFTKIMNLKDEHVFVTKRAINSVIQIFFIEPKMFARIPTREQGALIMLGSIPTSSP